MRAQVTTGLLVMACLAGTIAWELRPEKAKSVPSHSQPALTPGGAAMPAAVPNQVAEHVALSLARPLFSPDRRPPAAAGPSAPDTTLPRLTGILVSPTGRSAIFAGGPPPLILLEGGRIGAFTVRSIAPGEVTLVGPDGVRSLRPSFGAQRPASPAVSTALPIPRRPAPPAEDRPPLAASIEASDARKDAIPFEQNLAPSGLDILRHGAESAQAAKR